MFKDSNFCMGGFALAYGTPPPHLPSLNTCLQARGQRERGRGGNLLNLTDFTKIIPILEDLLFAIRYSEFKII